MANEQEEQKKEEPSIPLYLVQKPRLNIGTLSMPLSAATKSFVILGKRGSGKALALDTPLPTPSGWTTMGCIKEGEYVFDEGGNPCKVLSTSEIQISHVCYRVVFSDGSFIVADAEHLWLSETLSSRASDAQKRHYAHRERGRKGRPQCCRRIFPVLATTEQISNTLSVKIGESGRLDRNHSVRCAEPLKLPDIKLPIEPYILGVWLGNGTSSNAHITTRDLDMVKFIEEEGFCVGKPVSFSKNHIAASYNIGNHKDGERFIAKLRKFNLLNNKHIPLLYLRASYQQRLLLLQGLMDTDGTIPNNSNSCEFDNTNKNISDGVEELVASLGGIARRTEKIGKLNGKNYKLCHRVRFRPSFQAFRVKRKLKKLNLKKTQLTRHLRRMIVSVEPVPSVPVKCITVESESHLYLAGKSMIPTHNSYGGAVLAEEMHKNNIPFVVFDPIDVWWGLRLSANGKNKGLPIVVFGLEHADIKLERDMGRRIAQAVVKKNISCVISTFGMPKVAQRHLIAEFAEELLTINNTPRHVFIEESHEYTPQRLYAGIEKCFNAVSNLVVMGRNRGIGVTMLNQRASTINKDLLTQTDSLLAFRNIAPQDRSALRDWVEYHAAEGDFDKFMQSLPSLPTGECWIWSPEFLDLFTRIKIRKRETFHPDREKLGNRFEMPHIDQGDVQEFISEFRGEQGSPVVSSTMQETTGNAGKGVEMPRMPEKTNHIEQRSTIVPLRGTKEILDERGEAIALRNKYDEELTLLKLEVQKLRKAKELLEQIRTLLSGSLPLDSLQNNAFVQHSHSNLSLWLEKLGSSMPAAILKFLSTRKGLKYTKSQIALACGYSSGGGSFNNALSLLKKNNLIIKDGENYRVNDDL